jgi:2-aminoethylphosphonate-pyruvate transaminase
MTAFKGPDGQEDMPYLLQPGPVTTPRAVKFAMLCDYGPQDKEFRSILSATLKGLMDVANLQDDYGCFLLPGNHETAMEAVIGTLCPAKRKKTLVIANGTSGEAVIQMFERLDRPFLKLIYKETSRITTEDVTEALAGDKNISHVWMTHCETSSGMLNHAEDIAPLVKSKGLTMILDATTTFGGMEIDIAKNAIDVVITRPDACLEAVPGVGIVFAKRALFEGQPTSSASHAHDLQRLNQDIDHLNTNLPTHVVAALREALLIFQSEGGIEGRHQRYRRNANAVRERLRALGYSLFLPDVDTSPFIQTVLAPHATRYSFRALQTGLRQRGITIAPGTLVQRASFRVGCIGRVDEAVMLQFIKAIDEVMQSMDLQSLAPEPT